MFIELLENVGWVYRIYWPGTKYHYVGQTVNYKRRISAHISCFKNNKHVNRKMQRLFNKYGMPKFKKLIGIYPEGLDELEKYYIKKNYSARFCCNMLLNGKNLLGFKHSQKSKMQMSLKHTGKTLSSQHKESIRQSLLKVDFDRNKLKEQFTGSNNPKAKIVLDLQTGIFYDTLVEAASAKCLDYKSLSRSINRNKIKRPTLIYA